MGNVRRPAMHMAAVMASSLMADLVKKMVAEMVVMARMTLVAVMALLTLMNRNMRCLAMQMAFMAMLGNVHRRQC